jgi:hypothetical protein
MSWRMISAADRSKVCINVPSFVEVSLSKRNMKRWP